MMTELSELVRMLNGLQKMLEKYINKSNYAMTLLSQGDKCSYNNTIKELLYDAEDLNKTINDLCQAIKN